MGKKTSYPIFDINDEAAHQNQCNDVNNKVPIQVDGFRVIFRFIQHILQLYQTIHFP